MQERVSDLELCIVLKTNRDYKKRDEMWAPRVGLEPTTNGLTVRCSAELSYLGKTKAPLYQVW